MNCEAKVVEAVENEWDLNRLENAMYINQERARAEIIAMRARYRGSYSTEETRVPPYTDRVDKLVGTTIGLLDVDSNKQKNVQVRKATMVSPN